MRQPKGTVWAERALVVLILASLAGTLSLVVAMHRCAGTSRSATSSSTTPPIQSLSTSTKSESTRPASTPSYSLALTRVVDSKRQPLEYPGPPEPPKPAPLIQDPTRKLLAELSAATLREVESANQADRRAVSLETARRAAVAESERWRRREMLVKQQIRNLARRAERIDREIDSLAAERDVLAREGDALKAASSKDPGKGSYGVLPSKGPKGTWRRPIVLECSNGCVALRPKGPTFSMLDLSAMINPRSSPVILAIARELLRVQM